MIWLSGGLETSRAVCHNWSSAPPHLVPLIGSPPSLYEMQTEARKEQQESREELATTIQEVSERAEAQTEECHEA